MNLLFASFIHILEETKNFHVEKAHQIIFAKADERERKNLENKGKVSILNLF